MAKQKNTAKLSICEQCEKSSWLDGRWNVYNQKCLACGVRICKNMRLMNISKESQDARIEANILDWVKYGAYEKELRRLVET